MKTTLIRTAALTALVLGMGLSTTGVQAETTEAGTNQTVLTTTITADWTLVIPKDTTIAPYENITALGSVEVSGTLRNRVLV